MIPIWIRQVVVERGQTSHSDIHLGSSHTSTSGALVVAEVPLLGQLGDHTPGGGFRHLSITIHD